MSHWYHGVTGQPMYEVPKTGKGGGTRPTHIGDAKKLGLVPSVTTILGIVDKPALNKWKTDQLLKAVLDNPIKFNDEEEIWKKRMYAISQQVGRDAAEAGTIIHDALEQYYIGNGLAKEHEKFCRPVINLLHSKFPNVEWRSEEYFAHPRGFGGKCDLHALPCYEWPDGIILDFKTKSAEDFSKVKPYDEQCMQLVAYREGFNILKAKCFNLFISTKQEDTMLLHEWKEKDCEKACKMFYSLLDYYQVANNLGV